MPFLCFFSFGLCKEYSERTLVLLFSLSFFCFHFLYFSSLSASSQFFHFFTNRRASFPLFLLSDNLMTESICLNHSEIINCHCRSRCALAAAVAVQPCTTVFFRLQASLHSSTQHTTVQNVGVTIQFACHSEHERKKNPKELELKCALRWALVQQQQPLLSQYSLLHIADVNWGKKSFC